MEYVLIPNTELNVSRIALGTGAIGGWMWGGSSILLPLTDWNS
jgi:aryl-alcohol dehydrogenase-like predicted oxidoreductase